MLTNIIVRLPLVSLGHALGQGIYLFDRPHRRVVRRNLAFAFPHLPERAVGKLAREVFQNYGVTLLEILQLGFLTRHDIEQRVRLYGVQHFRDAYALRKGVIAVSAHLGNWELGMQALPCMFNEPLTGVAKKFKSNRFERWLHHIRTRFGNSILYKKDALADMTRILRQGGILAILVDMARRKDGIPIQFFGKKATATPAVAMLALRCRCPVVPTFCIREPDGRIGIHAEPPVDLRRSQDLRSDLVENTQRITDVVERVVRRHPEQWHWLMKRWKDFYPELYK